VLLLLPRIDFKAFITRTGGPTSGHEIAWKYGELLEHELAGSRDISAWKALF
jgi:hypothetical protein